MSWRTQEQADQDKSLDKQYFIYSNFDTLAHFIHYLYIHKFSNMNYFGWY